MRAAPAPTSAEAGQGWQAGPLCHASTAPTRPAGTSRITKLNALPPTRSSPLGPLPPCPAALLPCCPRPAQRAAACSRNTSQAPHQGAQRGGVPHHQHPHAVQLDEGQRGQRHGVVDGQEDQRLHGHVCKQGIKWWGEGRVGVRGGIGGGVGPAGRPRPAGGRGAASRQAGGGRSALLLDVPPRPCLQPDPARTDQVDGG